MSVIISRKMSAVTGPMLVVILACIVLCVKQVNSAAFPCSLPTFVDSYGSLPSVPAFASAAFTGEAISLTELVQGHFSEKAVMARPDVLTSIDASLTNCPYTAAGLKRWHDPLTWNEVPEANANVTLPPNSKVLVSSCSVDPNVVFGIVTIPATSELIFSDAEIRFQARGFNVQGALRIGSPTCRLRNKVTITLHGSRGAQTLPTQEYVKGIHVQGEIDIHGAQFHPTWTRLARTLLPGQNVLLVQDLVNWQVGQEIVVTTTELKDSRDFNRNEQLTITGVERVSDRVSAIRFTPSAQFKHYGGREYQAEVALLSRNIVVQGDAAGSPPTDTIPIACRDPTGNSTYPCPNHLTGFGAHIMVRGLAGRFSGLEVLRGGQTNVLARYPIHFHMMGQVTHQTVFAKDCSVHDSYFRCYAIHGTHGALLRENVAYNAIGSCYFIEDGVEENNTIAYNLGAHVHTIGPVQNPSLGIEANGGGSFWSQTLSFIDESPNLVLPSDLSAAVFYFTNPAQYILGNAASGGWAGYGFPALRKPLKLFENAADQMTPKDRPMWQFKGNTAHSSGFFWGSASGIYIGGELFHKTPGGPLSYTAGRVVSAGRDTCLEDPKVHYGYCPEALQLWQRFEDVKVFLINGRGIQHWGNRAELIRFEVWDVSLSMNVFGSVFIDDGLIVCRNANHGPQFLSGCPTAPPASNIPANLQSSYNCNIRDRYFFQSNAAFQFYDVSQRHFLRGVTFRNCDWSTFRPCYWRCEGGSVWSLLSHSSQFVPELMQATSQLTYTNCSTDKNLWKFSTPLEEADGPTISGRIQGWYDVDGSASLTGKRTMIGSNRSRRWWRYNEECFLKDEMWVCPLQSNQDSSVSLVIEGTHPNETRIGIDQCLNGEERIPKNCPIVGTITSFGFTEGTDSLDLGMNAKATGPLVGFSGGWFIRLSPGEGLGTPQTVTITQIQVDPKDRLTLAFPYPAATTFKVSALAASWCDSRWSECSKNFTQVETLDEVRYGDGSTFMFKDQILYLRVAWQDWDSFGRKNSTWSIPNQASQFSRGGMSLVYTSDQYRIVIEASECGGGSMTGGFKYCEAVPSVSVPAALGEVPLCTFPKPDWSLRCLFLQVHIELIVEFCVWLVIAMVLWRRTVVLFPLRMMCEYLLVTSTRKVCINRNKQNIADVFGFSIAAWFGFAAIICAADSIAVQVAAVLIAIGLFMGLFQYLGHSNRFASRPSKFVLASYSLHLSALALAFVVSYLTLFSGLRLYTMLVGTVMGMHAVLDGIPNKMYGYCWTRLPFETYAAADLIPQSMDQEMKNAGSGGKSTSTTELSSSLTDSKSPSKVPDNAVGTQLYSGIGKRVGFAIGSCAITAGALYISLVVATLY